MTSIKILSIGEVLWDLFPDGEKFGGAPANFACHAAILGGDVQLLSAVGDDARGNEAIRILKRCHINTSAIQLDHSKPTGTVGVEVEANGKHQFTIHENSAWDAIEWSPHLEETISNLDAIYFGTLAQRSEQSREAIRKALDYATQFDVARVLDVNLRSPFFDDDVIRHSIKLADIVKLSDDEIERVATACGIALTGGHEVILKQLRETFMLDLVAMTRGAEGAILVTEKEVVDQPGIPTNVVDTVGAGDAFTAAMLVGWLRNDALSDIARYACEIASATCAHRGAVPQPDA